MSAQVLRVAEYSVRATPRGLYGGYLTIILLIGFIEGIALGSTAAARQTDSSFSSCLASTKTDRERGRRKKCSCCVDASGTTRSIAVPLRPVYALVGGAMSLRGIFGGLTPNLTVAGRSAQPVLPVGNRASVGLVDGRLTGSFLARFQPKAAVIGPLDLSVAICEPPRFVRRGPGGSSHCDGMVSESLHAGPNSSVVLE